MESAEVGHCGRSFGQPADRLLESRALIDPHLLDVLVELPDDVDHHFDEEGHRASCGADVGHEQHG
ncbi:hypothetical protein, partial [uncultured Gordonia sp.]|uniref:hypothetical protein n=1 Tax=uncultured Gordonia sp. TaxID=198437 RepID=UPI00258F538D